MYTVTEFTPWTALGGGMLIGLSALLMLGFNGRIAGISGIVGNLVTSRGSDLSWRLAFTLGLIAGAYGFIAFAPPDATLFPYTTLFRSECKIGRASCRERV